MICSLGIIWCPNQNSETADLQNPAYLRPDIPWHGRKLFVGTGAYGSLPVMPEVFEEARKKGI
jgi:hypothetical protein